MMLASPFGSSEMDWLLYADYIDERGESERANLIREEVADEIQPWNWEYRFPHVGGGIVGSGVGSGVGVGNGVGVVGVGGVGGGGVGSSVGGVSGVGGGIVGVGGVGVGGVGGD